MAGPNVFVIEGDVVAPMNADGDGSFYAAKAHYGVEARL
jgi:hypothetical protein